MGADQCVEHSSGCLNCVSLCLAAHTSQSIETDNTAKSSNILIVFCLVTAATKMEVIPCSLTSHPASLFHPPPPSSPSSHQSPSPIQSVTDHGLRSCSSSSIDTEFTHFRPIRRHPVTPSKQVTIARPTPVMATVISTDCTLSSLTIQTDKEKDKARVMQEKMDYELAWRIHNQEKRSMLRQTNTGKVAQGRSKTRQEREESMGRREMKMTGKTGVNTWQAQVRRQQTRR